MVFGQVCVRVSGFLGAHRMQRRMFVWLLGVALVNMVGQKLYFNIYKNTCSTENSVDMITNTCSQYKTGVVAGSLCPALCDNDAISYRHCVNWRFGKTVAYVDYSKPEGPSQLLVLKVMLNPPDNNFTLFDFIETRNNYTSKQLIASFNDNLIKLLKDKYDFTFSDTNFDLISYMWGYNVTAYVANSHDKLGALRTAIRSVWYLLQQREYVFSKLYQTHRFATKVVGNCGAIYFLEYSKSLSEIKFGLLNGRGLSIHTQDWRMRAKSAINILQLLPTLNSSFHQPLVMCDIKEANIGVSGDSEVVLIDSDDIHYEGSLSKTHSDIYCTEHAHCGRNTCVFRCDKQRHRCSGERSNNNLQGVCERVFLNKVGFAQTGLLSGAPSPVKKELSILLYKCAYPPNGVSPTWDDRHVIHKPEDALRVGIIDVLNRGISL